MKIRAATRTIRPMYMLALVLVAATLTLGAGDAGAQVAIDAPTIYRLNPASSFQQGCFPPDALQSPRLIVAGEACL